MDIKNSSYYKFYKYTLFFLVSAVVLVGVFMIAVSTGLYKNEKLDNIRTVGELFISGIKTEYSATGSMHSGSITELHQKYTDDYGITMYVYDENGSCILSGDGQTFDKLSSDMMETLDKNDYLDFDSNNVSMKAPNIMYGSRFLVKYGENTPQHIYLTVYGNAKGINAFTLKMLIVFFAAGAVCIYLCHFFMKKGIIKYARGEAEFVRVSQKYSKGDFSEKIDMNLSGSIYEAAKYVNALAANMEKSDDTSKTFIANVSHELRTPITTIGGFVDGILDGTIQKSRQQEYLVLVSKEIKRLRILISSMLNMTRFESGTLKPNFTDTNLTDLVIQTVFMFEKKINDKKIEIEGLDSDRLTAVVDADLIQQVIYNLVENAVKFVNNGGVISFSFKKKDGICSVGIKNTGEGLKNEEIQQVFDRFYKTDSSRGKDTSGLGLGLSISRKIVHLHGGHIVVKSVSGEYTEFSVELPEKQK